VATPAPLTWQTIFFTMYQSPSTSITSPLLVLGGSECTPRLRGGGDVTLTSNLSGSCAERAAGGRGGALRPPRPGRPVTGATRDALPSPPSGGGFAACPFPGRIPAPEIGAFPDSVSRRPGKGEGSPDSPATATTTRREVRIPRASLPLSRGVRPRERRRGVLPLSMPLFSSRSIRSGRICTDRAPKVFPGAGGMRGSDRPRGPPLTILYLRRRHSIPRFRGRTARL